MNTTTHAQLIQPYLFFGGRCEEALEFYKAALGAKVLMMMRFKEAPDSPPPGTTPAGWENKVMHAEFRVGSTAIMASDGCESAAGFSGFSLSLSVASEAAADTVFAALAEGGKVDMPLGKTFWSPRFGMLTDRFGIGWMVNVSCEPGAAK
jgi:PhnB protein